MARTGITGKLWLALLKEGGRLTAVETADLVKEADRANARVVLFGMAELGSVRKYDPPTGKHGTRFGVTRECKVPAGITIGDILACDLPGES